VHDEAVQPGVEPVRIADRPNVQPGRDERLLDRVGGEVVAAQDESSDPMESVERVACQCGERIVVTARG
jgi:hypothetical protein